MVVLIPILILVSGGILGIVLGLLSVGGLSILSMIISILSIIRGVIALKDLR